MRGVSRLVLMTVLLLPGASSAWAQEAKAYVGALVGVSVLSPDARAVTTQQAASVAQFTPQNGAAVNALVGVHVGRFVSIQANYVWNRNDLTLFSSSVTTAGGTASQQLRTSRQHAFVGDALLYVRERNNRIRPYLSAGLGATRVETEPKPSMLVSAVTLTEPRLTSTQAVLRVAVGIDLVVLGRASFRFTYSDTISRNPTSARLTPAGERKLMNFQSLFGAIVRL